MVSTGIKSEGAFYHKGKKEWISKVFGLYDSIIFRGEKLEDGSIAEKNLLYLGNIYLQSLNSFNIKPINYTYWRSLESKIASRLYEILGIKFYGIRNKKEGFIRYKYSTLCQLLPVTLHSYISSAKRQLNPGNNELRDTGFISKFDWSENGNGDWLIYYWPGERAKEEMKNKVSILLIILFILVVSIFLFNFRYTDYNSGIKLYQKDHLHEAKIQLMKVTSQDKKYAEAQNMLSIIDQEIENARIKEEAEKESLRIKEIAQLEEEVKEVPYSDYEKNYQIYQRLCELDPNNDRYLKKMNQYKTLYAKQVDEQYKESQRIMEEWKRDQENAESYDEIAFELASIDKGKIINRDDVSVNRFRYLLKTLDSKTSETKVQIADMTVKAQRILRDEYGKEVSLLFLMENVNDAIPSGANAKYAEIITAYILLIK